MQNLNHIGAGGVKRGGVGFKIILSNDTLNHAHSHPPSHNIRNILDGVMRKQKMTPARNPRQWLLLFRRGHLRGGNWEKACGMGELVAIIWDHMGSSQLIWYRVGFSGTPGIIDGLI